MRAPPVRPARRAALRRVAIAILAAWASAIAVPAVAAVPVAEAESADDGPEPYSARAPIGVFDDIVIERGQWMLSYRYERAHYDGLRDGSERISVDEAIASGNYDTVPTEWEVQVHHLSLLWSPADRVALSVVIPLVELDMQHAGEAPLHTFGIGDMKLGVFGRFMEKGSEKIDVGLALGVPTGSVSENGPLVAGSRRQPYPMQPGGGTWSLEPVITYGGQHGAASWGFQLGSAFNFGHNREGWRHGIQWGFSGWGVWNLTDWIRTSVRIGYAKWNNVNGRDARLPVPALSPTQDPYRQSGMRLDLGPGVDLRVPGLPGQRLAFEMLWPIFEDLQGPQLAQDWRLTAGWQWAF